MTANQTTAQDFFEAGGTLGPGAPSYVMRTADIELPRLVLAGHFCYVLTARQMGKSSLMIRAAKRLQAAGVRTVVVELTQIGSQGGIEAWYLSLINQIHRELDLSMDYLFQIKYNQKDVLKSFFLLFLYLIVLAKKIIP